MQKILNTLLLAVFIAVLLVTSRWVGHQAYSWMPTQGTAEAQKVDDLFSFLVAVGTFIFLGIVGLIMYSVLLYRVPKGDFSDGSPSRGNVKLEIVWTIVPVLFVMWIATQSYKIYQEIDIQGLTPIVHLHIPMADEPANAATEPTDVNNRAKPVALEVMVMAKQWSWAFRYPGNITSTELHLPVNETVRLKLQSQDVLHGFYVPEFRIKQDIIPNRTLNFTLTPLRVGKYRLRDSQFSGTYFPLMEADVYVESSDAYNQWLTASASQQPSPAKNSAFSEHTLGAVRGWPTIVPAQPPIVNQP